MAGGKTRAVVIGSFPLGESDRIVSFFSREYGKVRGIARAARRMRSRFGSALELFTLGDLVFFESARSDLVQVDHFDIVRPFERVRGDLERLGQAAWMVECVARLTADHDPSPTLYGLLVRSLRSVEAGEPPRRVATTFGLRCVDALGHRLRLDACVGCGRRGAPAGTPIAIDVEAGGVLCGTCAVRTRGSVRVERHTLGALRKLRATSWADALDLALGETEDHVREIVDLHVARLCGQPVRAARFLREIGRPWPTTAGPRDSRPGGPRLAPARQRRGESDL
jgi:DNA repair protein RecO (recombination protein O)